jgi:hypothetical protein
MHASNDSPQWGPQLHIVFSVLIGVSFAEALTILGQAHFEPTQLLLITTVFYVVLDCWYSLHLELPHLRLAGGWDIALHLLALVAYSCLPFLYFAHTASTPTFEAPEFLAANLSLICFLDAIRRNVVFAKNGNSAGADEQLWHKKNTYLILSGYAFGVMLALGTLAFTASHLSTIWRAGIILVVWLAFRVIDRIYIDKLATSPSSEPQV